MSSEKLTPEVTWAQRSSETNNEKNFVLIHIVAPDVSEDKSKLNLEPTKLTYTGYSETKKVTYHVELEFYKEVNTEGKNRIRNSPRGLDLVLEKKDLGIEYWPRLLKESKKSHFLRTDFDRWIDEDEQDGDKQNEEFDMNQGFEGLDFSKLGDMGGAGMGAGAEDDGLDEEEEEDDAPPPLEEASSAHASAST